MCVAFVKQISFSFTNLRARSPSPSLASRTMHFILSARYTECMLRKKKLILSDVNISEDSSTVSASDDDDDDVVAYIPVLSRVRDLYLQIMTLKFPAASLTTP